MDVKNVLMAQHAYFVAQASSSITQTSVNNVKSAAAPVMRQAVVSLVLQDST